MHENYEYLKPTHVQRNMIGAYMLLPIVIFSSGSGHLIINMESQVLQFW